MSNSKFDEKQCIVGPNDILKNKEDCNKYNNDCRKKVYIEDDKYFFCRKYPMSNCHYKNIYKKKGLCNNQEQIKKTLETLRTKNQQVDSLIHDYKMSINSENISSRLPSPPNARKIRGPLPSDAKLKEKIDALNSKPLPSDAELQRRINALKSKKGGKQKKKSKPSRKSRKLNKQSRKLNKQSRKNKGGTTIASSHPVIPSDDLVKVLEKENIKMNDELIWTNNNSDNENMHYQWRVKVKPLEHNSNIKTIGTPQYKFYNNSNSMWSYNLPLGFPEQIEGQDIPFWSRVIIHVFRENESDSD